MPLKLRGVSAVRRRPITNGNGAGHTPASGLPLNGGGGPSSGGPGGASGLAGGQGPGPSSAGGPFGGLGGPSGNLPVPVTQARGANSSRAVDSDAPSSSRSGSPVGAGARKGG